MMIFALIFSAFLCRTNTVSAQSNITFLHINDHHSHFEELSFDIVDPTLIPDDLSVESENIRMYYGGFPRAVGLYYYFEEQADGPVVKVHAGDAITGTFFYTFFGPEMDAVGMNIIGFDAFVLGNHEFDDGDSNVADFLNMLDAPALSANLNPAETSAIRNLSEEKRVRPYMIMTLEDGEQLGICGITIKVTTEQSSFPDVGTTLADETETAIKCVADLEAEGVNRILLLTHMGNSRDIEWLSDVDGIDVVIGGHSHSLLGGEDFTQLDFAVRGDYAVLANGKCIVTAWEHVRVVGSLTVNFDADGVVTGCSGAAKIPLNPDRYTVRDADTRFDLNETDAAIMTEFLLNLPNSPFVNVEPDAAALDALAPFFDQTDTKRNEVIGTATESICHTYAENDPLCPGRNVTNCLSGGVCNLVSQGFLFNAPAADFAIQNRGGCRTDINAGDITFGSVFDILPFANTLVSFEMTGDEIKALLEDAVNFFLDPELGGGAGSYPFAAGLRYDIDYTATFGNRITNLEANPKLAGDFAPIEGSTTYVVVTNSFVAGGRDGYLTFTNDNIVATQVDLGVEYGQSFVNYILQEKSISDPPLDEFSTQVLVQSDGNICNVEEALVDEDTSAPTSAPAPSAATTMGVAAVVASIILSIVM